MDVDALTVSRAQFAFVVAFHILFPAFTIGLSAYIAFLEGLGLATGRPHYVRLSIMWTKAFAISFGMGVVSGIVMAYQFGTNWSRFADATAPVLGPLFAYEVITAFFLEASFLGILLFGRRLVPRPLHFASAVLVAIGTSLSAFWILSANSWMHTPAGSALVDGRFVAKDWAAIVFNPSFPYRLAHMLTAAFLTTAFVVIAVGARYLLAKRHEDAGRAMLSTTLWLVALLAPLQVALGDLHGLNTLQHQPVKIAAIEGHWEPQRGAPAILFEIPDPAAERNRFEIAVPKLASLILTHDPDGAVPGLKEWPPADRPNVPLVFWSFRVMVAIGFLMVFIALAGLGLRAAGRVYSARWFLKLCAAAAPIGFIAVLAGWVTTESGRQPWLVQGLMRTAEGHSPGLAPATVLFSFASFAAAYAVIFAAGASAIVRILRRGPEDAPPAPKAPESPLAAARDAG